ncbi:MAG TPA: acyltransferase [Clostridia bacterium]
MIANKNINKKDSHIDILDGLRGIAIVMVVLFHIWQQSWLNHSINIGGLSIDLNFIPATGYLGVELFFFISAFCLFYPYARHMIEGYKLQSVRQFAYRRAIKIIPSYFLSIILILAIIGGNFGSISDAMKHIVTHIFFIHSWFPDTYGSINGVFWSLAVEVQFYFIFPLICWLFRKKPLIVYISMSIFSIAFRYYIQNYKPDDFHFLLNQLPCFLDIFGAGMFAAYLFVLMKNRIKNIEALAPFFTILSVLFFIIFYYMLKWLYDLHFPDEGIKLWQSQNRIYLSLIFLLITISSAFSIKIYRKILANKLLVFLSVISYNLYIWHQLVALELLKRKIPAPQTSDPHSEFTWQISFTLLSIFSGILLSSIITYGFERPLLKNGVKNTFRNIRGLLGKTPATGKHIGHK